MSINNLTSQFNQFKFKDFKLPTITYSTDDYKAVFKNADKDNSRTLSKAELEAYRDKPKYYMQVMGIDGRPAGAKDQDITNTMIRNFDQFANPLSRFGFNGTGEITEFSLISVAGRDGNKNNITERDLTGSTSLPPVIGGGFIPNPDTNPYTNPYTNPFPGIGDKIRNWNPYQPGSGFGQPVYGPAPNPFGNEHYYPAWNEKPINGTPTVGGVAVKPTSNLRINPNLKISPSTGLDPLWSELRLFLPQ